METQQSEVSGNQDFFSSLGLEPHLFVSQLVNFLLVLAILWFLILKPLTKKLEERRQIIDESLDNAKRVQTELTMAEEHAKEIMMKAEQEGSRRIQTSVEEAEAASATARAKAKQDIEVLIAQAKRKIDDEKVTMRQEIRQETAALIISALEKILPEKFDKKTDEAFVKDMLKKIGQA